MAKLFSYIKWNHVLSDVFAIRFGGVRQGSVLSSFLFAIYLDDIPVFRSLILRSFVVMYADDILLIAPPVSELQRLFQACEREQSNLDMCINVDILWVHAKCSLLYSCVWMGGWWDGWYFTIFRFCFY